jgi:oligopeptide transport system substrate-binding protein
MPGSVVYPIDTLARTIPWLPLEEEGLRTGTTYLVINMKRPPFNNPAVRQALAAAVDREALAELAVLYYSIDPEPATSFIPPSILSRDLYGIVGIPFDPTHARELLAEAGYKDSKTFPVVKIITSPAGTYAPGARLKFAEAIATMWEEYLGITVEVQGISSATFKEIRKKSPPDVSFMAWAADYYDPHIFSGALFKTNSEYSEYNYGAHIPHLILAEIGNIK